MKKLIIKGAKIIAVAVKKYEQDKPKWRN